MNTAVLHYSAFPVIGGVETAIQAHAAQFAIAGMPLTVICGRGEAGAMPRGVDFIRIAEIDSMHPEISTATEVLNTGEIPPSFERLVDSLANQLRPVVSQFDNLLVHNVLSKHFNLPLTAALFRLMDEGVIKHTVAWCHDLSWSSPNSRNRVYPAYPWNLLKRIHSNVTYYVAISKQRQREVLETFGCPPESVPIVYTGVDADTLFSLSPEGAALIERLDLFSSDLILLMPVRITQAKNIEFALEVLAALKRMKCRPKLVLTGPPDPHEPASIAYYRSLIDLRRRLDVENEMHFVFACGPKPGEGYYIDQRVVSDLFRVADAMFMPSHREGFGMPVLEAGLLGLPVISTPMPAVQEVAQDKDLVFSHDTDPSDLAERILKWLRNKPEHIFRVDVRQNYTWKAIFKNAILPLLKNGG